MVYKITGTRSEIYIDCGDRTITVEGELTLTPAFYASINSMTCWDPPFEKEPFTDVERNKVIEEALAYSKDKPLKIYFD
jgi:hypothetical protein